MRTKRLRVTLSGHEVGALTQNRHGLVQWVPDETWDAAQVPRLGLDFLRTRGPRQHASELPPWFENLLPERDSRLRRRLAAAHGLREGQSYDLLGALGQDLLGAVEIFAGEPGSEANGAAVATPRPPSAGPLRLSGLTGMQLKFSMSMVNERLMLDAQGGGARWIVKLPGTEWPELAEVEAATMTWAKLSGFPVPEHFTIPYDRLDGIPEGWLDDAGRDGPALAVRRFDRRVDGTKVHQEDFCQALALAPANKYGDAAPRVTIEGALRLVADACGEDQGREMARRIGFVIASGNGDAHLKNWSFVWGDRMRPMLSPCYDFVATIAWAERLGWERREGPELALRFGGTSLFRQVDEMRLEEFAKLVGHAWAAREVRAGIESARAAWPQLATTAPLRMKEALAVHWANVPLLRDGG